MYKNNIKINVFYKKRIKITLVRPLLVFKRIELFKLCTFWGVPRYVDLTNTLLNFRRNRLRHQILPLLRLFFNLKLDDSLSRFIKFSSFNDYYLTQPFLQAKQLLINIDNYKNRPLTSSWVSYLPFGLYKKFYYYFSVVNFKYLTFKEITYFLESNTLFFK